MSNDLIQFHEDNDTVDRWRDDGKEDSHTALRNVSIADAVMAKVANSLQEVQAENGGGLIRSKYLCCRSY